MKTDGAFGSLFLTSCGTPDQTMKDSPFYMTRVVELEMQITTNMSRFSVHFFGQFWTPLHDQTVQERKGRKILTMDGYG
jgi:hypothetical protein